jgi:hypothetical protein
VEIREVEALDFQYSEPLDAVDQRHPQAGATGGGGRQDLYLSERASRQSGVDLKRLDRLGYRVVDRNGMQVALVVVDQIHGDP